jgi:pimeloyl-ACP methyl ester carboxylesterase
MPADTQPASSGEAAKSTKAGASAGDKKPLKILMLHGNGTLVLHLVASVTTKLIPIPGYTQSGQLFRNKTGALSKPLNKFLAMPPVAVAPSLIYPTGPFRLKPSDIPGYQRGEEAGEADEDEETDCWAWFRRDDATGTYRGLPDGMQRVAEAIREAGGVDGVVGFSQGGSMAAMVAAAMEPGREVPAEAASWALPLREANGGEALKFAVVYSGFVARDEHLQWLYQGNITTPTLHFIGGLDTVVEESRSVALVERCVDPKQVVHPGGHYVPVSKDWVGVLVGFIRDVLSREEGEATVNAKV